jgi:8-oxo-dGTP pyrophosphatase MutT (NUDIX family)
MQRQLEVSSGGVIYRFSERGIEVALTQTNRGPMWCLPKGRVEDTETLEEAAVREVKEETGLSGSIAKPLRQIEYTYHARSGDGIRTSVAKIVHFFLMEFREGTTADHDTEVVDVRWFPLDVAGRLLHHAGERDVLALAKTLLGEISSARAQTPRADHTE